MTRLRVTDSPEGYDGFGTKTVEWLGCSTKKGPVRTVEIQDEHFDWQTMRYSSGLHLWMDFERWVDLRDLLIEDK